MFDAIVREYREFLAEVRIEPRHFIPISAREGEGVAARGAHLGWYDGPTVLEALDGLSKAAPSRELPLRMPVQDVYKFNERGDDRRIIAGRIEAGGLAVGDKVLFSPSGKSAAIESIEVFSAPPKREAFAGESIGVTLDQQLYVTRGEVMCLLRSSRPGAPAAAPPLVSTKLRVNLFWLGREPMVPGQRYKLKLANAATEVTIDEVVRVLDASSLDASTQKGQVERHDVADLILRTRQPVAFDTAADIEVTGRFVIVDGYDIAGGGIVREAVADDLSQRRLERQLRDRDWVHGDITPERRADLAGHSASMVMITGRSGVGKMAIARALERRLVEARHRAYLLNGKNLVLGVDADIAFDDIGELVRRFGEVAHLLLDAGLLVISTTNVIGLGDYTAITTQVSPFSTFVVHVGPEDEDLPEAADLRFDPRPDPDATARTILAQLATRRLLRSDFDPQGG